MEIVGVIAAVPPLLQMVKRTGVALAQISSKTRIGKAAQGTRAQLDLLAELLASIEGRLGMRDTTGSRSLEARLGPVLRDLETEMTSLLDLVDRIEGSKGSNVLRRAQLVLSGFEKDLREHGQRIDHVLGMLQIFISEWNIRSSQRSQIRKLLAAPATTDFIPKKLDGTLEWVWVHEPFAKWVRPDNNPSLSHDLESRVLIIHGVKGCGKSVLAASVVDGLREKGNVALFFSFWASHDRERRIDAMLRGLLWQLLEALPEERQFTLIKRLLDGRAQLRDPEFLAGHLRDMAQAYSSDLFCVLDGIDESTDDWNDPSSDGPLAHLDKILQAIPRLHLLLIGRQSNLRSAIRKWPHRFELNRDLVLEDLNRFISAELDNCPNVTEDETRSVIRRELDAKSTVMFLWVKLVFQELRASFSLGEVSYTLGHMPQELDREYSRMFSILTTRMHGRSDNPSAGMVRAKGLLEIIIGASRPLSLTELRLVYAFKSMPDKLSANYSDYLVSEEAIVDACGDFVTIKDGFVCLGHTSIREFLLRPADRWTAQDGTIAYFRLDSQNCHRVLAVACLTYLQHIDWGQRDSASTDRNLCLWADSLSRHYPLLHYASSFTTSHFLDSDVSPEEASSKVQAFLMSGKLVSWIDFASFTSNGNSSPIPPPPLHFWEDVLNFWSICCPPGTIEAIESFADAVSDWHAITSASDSDGKGSAKVPALMPSSAEAAISTRDVQTARLAARNGNTEGANLHVDMAVQGLQHALKKMGSNRSTFGKIQPALRLQAISGLVRTAGIFIDPLEVVIRAFERAIGRASFLHLMLVGHILHDRGEEAEALKIFEKALLRVKGRGDLREAWALLFVALCGDDSDISQTQCKEVLDLLESRRENPLCGLLSAAVCLSRASFLFNLDRHGEGKLAAAEAENRLLNHAIASASWSRRGKLRQWSYRQVSTSKTFTILKMGLVIGLCSLYNDEDLHEEVGRVLGPYVHDIGVNDCPSRFLVIICMRMAATAKFFLKQDDEAMSILVEAKELLKHDDDTERLELSAVQHMMAIIYLRRGHFREASDEIASMDVPLYLEIIAEDEELKALGSFTILFLDTHWALGQLDEAEQEYAKTHWPVLQKAFETGKLQRNSRLNRIVSFLLTYGLFAASELCLRQMLRPRYLEAVSDEVEKVILLEGLAFSVRHQGRRSTRSEAYDLYTECVKLAAERVPDRRSYRLQFGLGMACVTAGKPLEAAQAFEKVADEILEHHDHHCVLYMLHHLIRAMAMWQRGEVPEALWELHCIWPSRERNRFPCRILTPIYLDCAPKILAYILSAHMMSGCGKVTDSQRHRTKALEILHRQFEEALRPIPVPGTTRVMNFWVTTWARSCSDYLLGMDKCEKTDTAQILPLFPLELFMDNWHHGASEHGGEDFDILRW